MNNELEVQHCLIAAEKEITELRRANEILTAKVETMEIFAMALRRRHSDRNTCMSEDIVWRMKRLVDEIETSRVARAT